jgi:4-hydroxythreonine-4-phosphate dehydrogenase
LKIRKTPEIIAVTLGDPAGIGPEIIKKSIKNLYINHPAVIIGSEKYYPVEDEIIISQLHEVQENRVYFYPVDPRRVAGDLSYVYVETAIKLALNRQVHALVTGPISKEKWIKAGHRYTGHTELLAKTAKIKQYSMFFWSRELKILLYTIHQPLRTIFPLIKKENIIKFIRFADIQLQKLFKHRFNFLICGLNPHAGEEGIIGREELEEIQPALEELKKEKIQIRGPLPADTIFLQALKSPGNVVLSWYHDQGLIPFKLLHLHTGVNLTLGLPYVRTSPDHGPAFDIAGKGISSAGSMLQAIQLADFLL